MPDLWNRPECRTMRMRRAGGPALGSTAIDRHAWAPGGRGMTRMVHVRTRATCGHVSATGAIA